MALFGILIGVTVLGIAETWPHHRTLPAPPGSYHPKTKKAHVVAVRSISCRVPGLHGCSIVTVQLDEGRARGTRTSLHFGDTGGNVRIGLGDRVLVYKNPLPANAVTPGNVHLDAYSFADFQRGRPLLLLAAIFALVVIAGGRFHGVRALVGLVASLAMIVFFVVPAFVDGRSPLQVAAFGGLGVMLLTIPLVHGGGRSRAPPPSAQPLPCC